MLPFKKWVTELPLMLNRQDPENLWLDYKDSRYLVSRGGAGINKQKRAEDLSKDVTAFLNSDSGTLICGIPEDDSLLATGGAPVPLAAFDPGKDGYARGEITKEDIENIITSNIQPKLSPDLYYVSEVELEDRIVFIIDVAKSMVGPFQARDMKYYERLHYKSEPMEHYRIEEVRNRSIGPQLEPIFGFSPTWENQMRFENDQSLIEVYFGIQNKGQGVVDSALFELGLISPLESPAPTHSVLTIELEKPQVTPQKSVMITDPKFGQSEVSFYWYTIPWHPGTDIFQPLFSMLDPTFVAKLHLKRESYLVEVLPIIWRVQALNMPVKQGMIGMSYTSPTHHQIKVEHYDWAFEIRR